MTESAYPQSWRRGRAHRAVVVVAACVLFTGLPGCPPEGPRQPEMGPIIPLPDAIVTVNANNQAFAGGLQGTGIARGHFKDRDGKRRSFDCDAKLLVIPPFHLRLDLQNLGQSQVLFGSNDEMYWLHIVPEIDTYWWGHYAALNKADTDGLAIRPDMVVEALGIQQMVSDTRGTAGPFQRVVGEYQQWLFVVYDEKGQGVLHKEYWVRRAEPRVIEQILFRDHLGRLIMRSSLSDYRPFGEGGSWIAHRADVDWPLEDGHMRLSVRNWSTNPKLTPEARAFIAPHERGKTFRRTICIDDEGS